MIQCSDHYLLLQRATNQLWTLAPGGKLEPAETPLQAAVRETFEETSIPLTPAQLRFLATYYFRYPEIDYPLHIFHATLPSRPTIILVPQEHTEYKWASINDALSLPLTRGSHECMEYLISLL